MLLLIHKLSRPVPFLHDGLLYPWNENKNKQDENIHPDILNDIQQIHKKHPNLLDELKLKDLMSLSIPYNIEPIRITDEIKR